MNAPAPGDPWAPPRPGAVTTAGVLTILLGIFGVLATLVVGGLVVALGLFVDGLAATKGGEETDRIAPYLVVVAVVVVAVGLVVGSLHVLLGVRVLRGGFVSRIVLTVWDGLLVAGGAVVAAATLLSALDGGGAGELVVLPLLGVAMPLAVLVCLWVPAASTWFARVHSAPDPEGLRP